MRRKDREMQNINEIFDILLRCDTIRIGIQGGEYPYVVPVSFGAELVGERPVIYFHCAREGQKLNLIEKNPNVCIEADRFIRTDSTGHGITTRYESVIGFGRCRFAESEDEILHGMQLFINHYGYTDYPLQQCQSLRGLKLGVVEIDTVSGKRNLPAVSAATEE